MTTHLASAPLDPAERATPLASVRVSGLTKRFAPHRSVRDMLRLRGRPAQVSAVDAATFEVADGEVFGLLGPNGAGKTTIFRMLSTMILPDGGTATVGGYDIVADAAPVPCGKRRCSASRSVR